MASVEVLPPILDPCCGSRCFYFDKADKRVLCCDIREENRIIGKNRTCYVRPDRLQDFRHQPAEWTDTFDTVFFDPPHLTHAGDNAWLRAKYGVLDPDTWPQYLGEGFSECLRVLKPQSPLIFKWNDFYIPLKDVLACAPAQPLMDVHGSKRSKTHFVLFAKDAAAQSPSVLDWTFGRGCRFFESPQRPNFLLKRGHVFWKMDEDWTERFNTVILNPPPFTDTAWHSGTWQNDLVEAFSEAFRVLKPNGSLIFVWNEWKVPLSDILTCTKRIPVIGNRLPTKAKLHFLYFIKRSEDLENLSQGELFL